MATKKDTWDCEDVGQFLHLSTVGQKDLMYEIFWGTLEHDIETAKRLANESKAHAPEIKKALKEFKKAYAQLEKVLLAATKNSEKF